MIMKVNVKSLLNNNKFIELQKIVQKINLDICSDANVTGGVLFDKLKVLDKQLKNLQNDNFINYKEALSKIDELYNDYSSDYADKIEFVVDFFNCLKNEMSKYIQKSDNSLPMQKQTNKQYYENIKNEYLDVLSQATSKDLTVLLIESELKTQTIEKLIYFIDNVEIMVNDILVSNNWDSSKRRECLDFILFSYLKDSTTITGNSIISQKIKVNKDAFDLNNSKSKNLLPLLNVASFLLNYINLHNSGMLDNNIGFDGYSFFTLNKGDRIRSNSFALNLTNLSNAERELQSNFVVNEKLAMALLSVHKKHMKVRGKDALIYTETKDGENFKVIKTLFKPQFCKDEILDDVYKDKLKLGYFVKVKKINLDNNNFEIILYYYCDKELKHGIQLFRADKVDSMFKGLPASHILRGGEKLYSTLHIHLYNIIDATLKNPEKESSLGAMDIAYNFLNPDSITINMAEEFFNQACGIVNKTLSQRNEDELYL